MRYSSSFQRYKRLIPSSCRWPALCAMANSYSCQNSHVPGQEGGWIRSSQPNDASISFVMMQHCTIWAIACKKSPCFFEAFSNLFTATSCCTRLFQAIAAFERKTTYPVMDHHVLRLVAWAASSRPPIPQNQTWCRLMLGSSSNYLPWEKRCMRLLSRLIGCSLDVT